MEVWKQIDWIESDKYWVSNIGNVKSYHKRTGGNLLKGYSNNGYKFFIIWVKGKLYNVNAHRLVAIAFIPNPDNKKTVNHINGIKDDNRVENLEWNTLQENLLHSYRMLGRKRMVGNKFCCVPVIQMNKDGSVIKEWESAFAAYKELKIHFQNISAVCYGKVRHAGGFKWKFKEKIIA